jgi:hypothetical protein
LPFGTLWVDRGNRVSRVRQNPGQLPLPTSHLQHPGRGATDPAEYELLDTQLPRRRITHGIPLALLTLLPNRDPPPTRLKVAGKVTNERAPRLPLTSFEAIGTVAVRQLSTSRRHPGWVPRPV